MRKSRWKRWGSAIAEVLLCPIFIYEGIPQMKEGELYGFFWCFIGLKMLVDGLWLVFSEKKYKEQERKELCTKRVYQYFFGKMAPVMEWAGGILLLFAVLCAVVQPPSLDWFVTVLLLAALIYTLVMYYIVRVEIKSDREKNGQD